LRKGIATGGLSINAPAFRFDITAHMKSFYPFALAILFLAVLGICVVGFIVLPELLPPVHQWTWRTAYVLVGLTCLVGVVRPLRCCRKRLKW
jgi:hypothetical protein